MYTLDGSQELVGNTAQQRNWRGIAIALLVILIVCALIVTAVIIATPKENKENLGEKFSFDDFMNDKFRPNSFHLQWLPGSNQFLYLSYDHFVRIFNCSSNSSVPIMDNSTFRNWSPSKFTLSADGRYLLLKFRTVPEYRHSTRAEYAVYDVQTGENPQPVMGHNAKSNILQYAAWSPTGHSLIMVQDNNVLYKADMKRDTKIRELTNTGIKGLIYNGRPDWVYEEEVLSSDNAIWWSPGSSYVLYATFNDTRVPTFHFPEYGELGAAYTSDHKIAYPKAGYTNPEFTLNIVKLSQPNMTVTLSPPAQLANSDYYFTTVAWLNDDYVMVTWLNRLQNHSILTTCRASDGSCKDSHEITAKGGWLDLNKPPLVSKDGTRYFWILPQKEDDAGYFKHIAMMDAREAPQRDKLTFVTFGQWEVQEIVGYDDDTQTLFFLSPFTDPRRLHLYSVSVEDKTVTCLSCDFDKQCQYNEASLAPTGDFYLLSCLGPGVPKYALMNRDGMEVERMENNTEFAELIAKKAMPWVKYQQVELDTGEKLWGKLLLPPVLKIEEILTYPLILQVYAGPGTQIVTEKFHIDWYTYLTSSREVIFGFVDARGTAGRGDRFLHAIYRQLGTKEVDDSILAAKQYGDLHYVDEKNMVIWGWSYGGFVAASALGRGTNVFRCGIAVAPVTDWIYYDSIYTERYMGLPFRDDNIDGYQKANVSRYAHNFQDARFMLIHGTADDNVHFQQSAQLVKALTEADVYFTFQLYTDKDHGIQGGNTRRHLFESMEDFLSQCFANRKRYEEADIEVRGPRSKWPKKQKYP